ncbi:hypothetical protein I3843_07G067200 [Carya illinoinensis]|nr:hypothetical protein I3843_07G067200 [Carya illinoinensis]
MITRCSGCLEEEQNALFLLKAFNYPNESFSPSSNLIHKESLEILSRLSKLEELWLDYIPFNGSLLPSLGKIATLKMLSLCGIMEWDYEANNIQGFERLSSLSKLEELYLDSNDFNDSILPSLGKIASLKKLSLIANKFGGSWVPNKCELKNLPELDLRDNNFEGRLPSCLTNMTELQVLNLAFHNFNGSISYSLSCLIKIFMSNNNTLVDETKSQSCTLCFQLKVLSLSISLARRPTRTIPKFLHYQYKLQAIDLSHNNLGGLFPTWLLENSTRLEILDLRNNSFTNPFHVPYRPNPHIRKIDISNNNLARRSDSDKLGFSFSQLNAFKHVSKCILSLRTLDLSSNHLSKTILPNHVGIGCPDLRYLKLSSNNLSGHLFPAKSNLTFLSFLYLDNNQFFGKIPYSLSNGANLIAFDFSSNSLLGMLPRWIGNMTNLIELCKVKKIRFLDLPENNFSNFIPSCFNSLNIKHVHLGKNRLSGPITNAFKNSSTLVTLDLRDNHLTNNIPNWIGNLSSLSVLLLKANHLQGRIPIQICLLGNLTIVVTYLETKIQIMIENDDDDYFPNVDARQEVEFTTKSRTYSYKGYILNYMSGIALSCNYLSAEIPLEFGNLSNIHELNLSHNNLIRSIPTTFSKLKVIESLDLSHNKLNGSISPQLIELNSLSVFSVADNNLSGKTPERKAQFETFEESSYEGNPFLYGPPLHNTWHKTGLPSNDKGEESGGFINMDFFYISFRVSYITVLLGIVAVLYINPHWRWEWFSFIEVCLTSFYFSLFVKSRKLSTF